jgi:hypothetical protein
MLFYKLNYYISKLETFCQDKLERFKKNLKFYLLFQELKNRIFDKLGFL